MKNEERRTKLEQEEVHRLTQREEVEPKRKLTKVQVCCVQSGGAVQTEHGIDRAKLQYDAYNKYFDRGNPPRFEFRRGRENCTSFGIWWRNGEKLDKMTFTMKTIPRVRAQRLGGRAEFGQKVKFELDGTVILMIGTATICLSSITMNTIHKINKSLTFANKSAADMTTGVDPPRLCSAQTTALSGFTPLAVLCHSTTQLDLKLSYSELSCFNGSDHCHRQTSVPPLPYATSMPLDLPQRWQQPSSTFLLS
ncbi:hypothetical protein C8F04DRAFT_1230430 [Mycena alexandri]|uniref:Uncharacterized protein n=1 Tax=Mycena alexandri TaxID=1745969 RepID=A0AAD6X993_9AGAR|nr:hypothetical protein C8F04DRAFT_1230430 [Mycena alexandri]